MDDAVDIPKLRAALAALRADSHLKILTFARVAGLNQQTVRRVEGIKRYPSYMPSYEVVQKWLIAAKKSSSAEEFISQFGKVSHRVTTSVDNPDLAQPFVVSRGDHGTARSQESRDRRAVPTAKDLTEADDIERLAFALLRAVAALRGYETVRPLDPHASKERSPGRRVVNGHAEPLPRVK